MIKIIFKIFVIGKILKSIIYKFLFFLNQIREVINK